MQWRNIYFNYSHIISDLMTSDTSLHNVLDGLPWFGSINSRADGREGLNTFLPTLFSPISS